MSMDERYVVEPAPVPVLPIHGIDALFAVHRIYCVGRNYGSTRRDGLRPDREPPFFFLKTPTPSVAERRGFPYPPRSHDVHHEVEMVVAIGKGGATSPPQALDHVWGYGIGLDMTRRDLQGEAKKLGRPWEIAKAFEHSAPMAELAPALRVGHPVQGGIWLKVNGKVRQEGDLNQMIWKVPEMIADRPGLFTLCARATSTLGSARGRRRRTPCRAGRRAVSKAWPRSPFRSSDGAAGSAGGPLR